jgi:hypothetical protein
MRSAKRLFPRCALLRLAVYGLFVFGRVPGTLFLTTCSLRVTALAAPPIFSKEAILMKKLTTMTAVAALIAGVSFAHAQNAGNTNSPSSINAKQHSTEGAQSGSQSTATAQMKKKTVQAAGETQSDHSVSPSDPNAKMPDTQSSKSGNQSAATKKMKKSTTGMKAGETSSSTVSPANIDAKKSDTFNSKSGSQSGGTTGPAK